MPTNSRPLTNLTAQTLGNACVVDAASKSEKMELTLKVVREPAALNPLSAPRLSPSENLYPRIARSARMFNDAINAPLLLQERTNGERNLCRHSNIVRPTYANVGVHCPRGGRPRARVVTLSHRSFFSLFLYVSGQVC